MKIVLINHTFQLKYYYRRWELFAEKHKDVDVTLLTPDKVEWYKNKAYSFGRTTTNYGQEIDKENFHIRTFKRVIIKGVWYSPDFRKLFTDIKPDIIYHLGTHNQYSLVQIGKITRKYLPSTKLILFSMRGPASNLSTIRQQVKLSNPSTLVKYLLSKYVIEYVNKNYDAVFCHYPDAVRCFRQEGFTKPIYMQTQVGVNTEWFRPSKEERKVIRDKYGLDNAYVFGSATRFTPDKGLDDIIDALPQEGDWKMLMIGSGAAHDIARVKRKIAERHLEDKIILPGFIEKLDMPQYWNAIDCAIHVPRTTEHWEETFSLSAIQPMATKKPIIANTSGSVPYQVGPDALVVEEGNIQQLHDKICWVLEHQKEAEDIGEKLYSRAVSCFSVEHLNQMFYDTILDVFSGEYDVNKTDMTKYQTTPIK